MNEVHSAAPDLQHAIDRAAAALLARQHHDGHWLFELEAYATIPAEYVLLRHYLGEPVDTELERKIAVYLRRRQGTHDDWPLFHEGDFDMSASVKAYFALKMIGDPIEAEHMRRAREARRENRDHLRRENKRQPQQNRLRRDQQREDAVAELACR